jgi:CHAT domain-containing protein/tetratricopeptide (TPR) repeat protein
MYSQVLVLPDAAPNAPDSLEETVQILALKSAALARLHNFGDAERALARADALCRMSDQPACGEVLRAHGILLLQQGQFLAARHFFEQTVTFARHHQDQFLEVTALLNLGLISLFEQRFDEAIDWTEAAYQTASTLDAGTIATKALGNLGWAYYNLGDSEKSLELSLEAEQRAIQSGDIIDQLSWTTNAGYAYADLGDLGHAKRSYLEALSLARSISGKQDIYNALRALALVSFEAGNLEDASKYADEAIALARSDNNRLDELYPLLVKGLLAAAVHDFEKAERILREVEKDRNCNASLRWRAEHGLARLYERQNRPGAAEREYRLALKTFEAARSSLRRNDSKLPFSSNVSRIYDDYLHFLALHHRSNDALFWADYSRARTLSEGMGISLSPATSSAPAFRPTEIAESIQGTILFYWLGERQSYLWTITQRATRLTLLPPRVELERTARRYAAALTGPGDVLASRDDDGIWLYRTLIAPSQTKPSRDTRFFIIADGALNNFNFETLIVPNPVPHYWIEDSTVVNASSLRLLSSSYRPNLKPLGLLLIGDSVSPNQTFPELPHAAIQMQRIARHFPPAQRQELQREQASPQGYLEAMPEQFTYIHFVAHGTASRLSPLDSAIILSKNNSASNQFKLYARDIVGHRVEANLVTISACYGAGERAYSGEGLVGLSWAFLRAGAHQVIAALWDANDISTERLMDQVYDELNQGTRVDSALRNAKLSLIHSRQFHNPFYWAPFQLYTLGHPISNSGHVKTAIPLDPFHYSASSAQTARGQFALR